MVEVELIINLFEVNFRYIITMVKQTVNQCPPDSNTKHFFFWNGINPSTESIDFSNARSWL